MVEDGDTIKAGLNQETVISIELDAIDAPKLLQPKGEEAKQLLSNLLAGNQVNVFMTSEKKFGIGIVLVDDQDIGAEW